MTEPAREKWLNRIAVTGLTVSDASAPEGVPLTLQAWKSVIGWDVEPVTKVPLNDPNVQEEVDRQWHAHATENGLFSDGGSFLLSVSGSSRDRGGIRPLGRRPAPSVERYPGYTKGPGSRGDPGPFGV
ncbi:hypothetical protein AB0G79_01780 [Streptomyces sp. NPDC020807]|uniref:hypothetical protein n=1 Tax=Streptomyces sp. NPDC020807 TaxID=3155119 RepID=UPI0033F57153